MPTTTSVSQDQAFQARATPVTNLTSSHNTMASPTSIPSAAGTALKRYLIRPRNKPGSTSQFRPLSPFQHPDLKHLLRSISRETQRASAPGTTDHWIRVETERTLSGVVWLIGFCDFSAVLRVRPACAGCHAEVSRSTSKSAPCESVVWRHCSLWPRSSQTNKFPRLQHNCNARSLSAMLTASATRARPCRTRAAARASERLLASGFEGLFGGARAFACGLLGNLRLPNAACSVYHALPLLDWLGRAAGAAQVSS
jgi:hypothetical protein